MTYPSLAIIGTAGRREDKDRLTHLHYDRMVSACIKFVQHHQIDNHTVKVFSGGAAWADHLAVTLAILGAIPYDNLTLFLPCDLTDSGYVGNNDWTTKTANTCNFYHTSFSKVTGKDSIRDLLEVRERGSHLIPGKGSFHARNGDVARSVSPDGALLAFTFGDPESNQPPWTIKYAGKAQAKTSGLKDGGTADTWDKTFGDKFHCRLGDME